MLPSWMDLVELLKRPEGKTLEFKRDLSSPDGALKTIVAFANTADRVAKGLDGPVVDFSWSGFDDGDPTSGRGSARIDGDTMRGKLFIHQGDDSTFAARREPAGKGGKQPTGVAGG